MIIPSGALFDRFGSFRIAAGVEAQPVFGIVDKSGAVSDLTGRSIVWRFLDVHNVVVGTPIAASVNGATATFALTGPLTEALRTGGVTGFEISMLTATGRTVLHRGAATIEDAAPFLAGVAGAPGTDSLTILAAAGTLIISAQGAPGSSTEALAAAALANAAAAAAQDRTTFADAAGRAANAAAVDSVAKTALTVAATGKADVATAAAKGATDDSIAKTALAVTATGAANAGAAAANTAAAQIVPEGGPSLLIKPATGTFPAIADAYFAGKKSLYSNFDGLRRQLRGFADVTDFARATSATYFDAAGVMQTAAVGVARLDYDPASKALRGLLVEPQATNLLTYSDGVIAMMPTKGGVTDSPGAIPNFTNAVRFVDNVSVRYAYKNFTGNPGVVYTFSVFVRMDDGALPVVSRTSNSGDFSLIVEQLISPNEHTVTPIGGGVYRCSVSFTATGASAAWGVVKYGGQSAKGFCVTGYQLEARSFATSYIATTAAQVTRARDVLTKALGAEFNPSAQTACLQFMVPAFGVAVLYAWEKVSIYLDGIYISMTATGVIRLAVTVGGVSTARILGQATLGWNKVCLGFGGNVLRGALNSVVAADINNTVPTGLTTRRIGSSSPGDEPGGWIMPYLPHPTNPLLDTTEYPRLLSAAEMQAYTA